MAEATKEGIFLSPINSLVGEGAKFNGEFLLSGSLRIDGEFQGKISSKAKVVVGESGHVQTNIQAKVVIVSGRVDGNIYATETVHLLKNAKIYGDIISPNLLMHEGVIFKGRAQIVT